MKKTLLTFIFLLFLFVILRCNNSSNKKGDIVTFKKNTLINICNRNVSKENIFSEEEQIFSMNGPVNLTKEELKMNVRKGDKSAYRKLFNSNLTSLDEHLFWAFFMAHRYNHSQAYFDVYYCFLDSYYCDEYSLEKMDSNSQKIALNYLQKAANKGHKQAQELIEQHYPFLLKNK